MLASWAFIVFGAIAVFVGWRWFARFRRENFHFRREEFYDPGSGYAAAIFFILGAAAVVFGVITLAESILSRLRWI